MTRVEGAQHGLIHFLAVVTFIVGMIIAYIRTRTGPPTPRSQSPEERSALLSSDGAAGAPELPSTLGLSPAAPSPRSARSSARSSAARHAVIGAAGDVRSSARSSARSPALELPATINHWNAAEGVMCSDNQRRRLVNGPSSPAPDGSECQVKYDACADFLTQAFAADPNAGGCCAAALLTPSDVHTTCSLLTQGCSSACYSAPSAASADTFEATTSANTVLSDTRKQWIANEWNTMITSITATCALTMNADICPSPLVFIGLPLHAELAWDTFVLAHWSPNQDGTCPTDASIPLFSGAVCTSTGGRQKTMLPHFLSLAGSWFKAASDHYDLSNPKQIARLVAHRRIPVVIDLLPVIFSTQFERAAFSALILKVSNDFVAAVFTNQNVVSSMIVGTPARLSVMQSQSFAAYSRMQHPLVVDLISSTHDSAAAAELRVGLKRAMSTYSCSTAPCWVGNAVVFCGHPSAVYYPKMELISKLRDVASDVFTYMMIAP